MSDHSGFSPLGNHVGDVFSGVVVVLAFLGKLFGFLGEGITYAGAFAGLVWFSIQIWMSRVIQHWWANKQMVRKAKKIAKLRAKEKIIVAKLAALERVRVARAAAREMVESAKVEAAVDAAHDVVTSAVED
jgi:hypothetical protein